MRPVLERRAGRICSAKQSEKEGRKEEDGKEDGEEGAASSAPTQRRHPVGVEALPHPLLFVEKTASGNRGRGQAPPLPGRVPFPVASLHFMRATCYRYPPRPQAWLLPGPDPSAGPDLRVALPPREADPLAPADAAPGGVWLEERLVPMPPVFAHVLTPVEILGLPAAIFHIPKPPGAAGDDAAFLPGGVYSPHGDFWISGRRWDRSGGGHGGRPYAAGAAMRSLS